MSSNVTVKRIILWSFYACVVILIVSLTLVYNRLDSYTMINLSSDDYRTTMIERIARSSSPYDAQQKIEQLQNEIVALRNRLEQLEFQHNRDSIATSGSDNLDQSQTKRFTKIKLLPYSKKRRILISGGAGFVGSHLVDRLMTDGHEVIVADNFCTGRRRNIEHWLGHPNFELLHHDIVNSLHVEVDEIYHLASPASPPHYMDNAVKTIKTNTIGTINMLGLAKRVGARILIASTSEVYGDPTVHPQREDYWGHVNPIGPRSCYDEGKRVAESLTIAYKKQEMLNVRIARIFNTYGPRMLVNDGRVVSNFISQALMGNPLTVYGNGEQTRSFQYVDDLIDGLVRLMASNYSMPVNLGNPDEYTINRFAMIVVRLVNGTVVKRENLLKHGPKPQDDPSRRRPDISLARRVLNWHPNVSLADGLAYTIEYFRSELRLSMGQQAKSVN